MEIVQDKSEQGSRQEKDITWVFDLALILKLINGGLEVLVALLVLVIPASLVVKVTEFITGGELSQDPDDLVSTALRNAAHSFAIHTHYLLAIYLALHGAVKIILVIGIFKGKKIAYPLFMAALAIFATYETYRGFIRHELLLQIFAVIDFSILVLTSYEYRRRYPTLPRHSFSPGS